MTEREREEGRERERMSVVKNHGSVQVVYTVLQTVFFSINNIHRCVHFTHTHTHTQQDHPQVFHF